MSHDFACSVDRVDEHAGGCNQEHESLKATLHEAISFATCIQWNNSYIRLKFFDVNVILNVGAVKL